MPDAMKSFLSFNWFPPPFMAGETDSGGLLLQPDEVSFDSQHDICPDYQMPDVLMPDVMVISAAAQQEAMRIQLLTGVY